MYLLFDDYVENAEKILFIHNNLLTINLYYNSLSR